MKRLDNDKGQANESRKIRERFQKEAVLLEDANENK